MTPFRPDDIPRDRRRFVPNQVVQVRPDAPEFAELWMVVKAVDPDYLTGLIFVEGECPVLTRLPRQHVESAIRVFLRGDRV